MGHRCFLGQRTPSGRDTGSQKQAEELSARDIPGRPGTYGQGSEVSSPTLQPPLLPSASTSGTEMTSPWASSTCPHKAFPGSSTPTHGGVSSESGIRRRQTSEHFYRGAERVATLASGWKLAEDRLVPAQEPGASLRPPFLGGPSAQLSMSQRTLIQIIVILVFIEKTLGSCLRVTDEADVKSSIIGCQYPITPG